MVTVGSNYDPGLEWTVAKLHRQPSELAPDASDRASSDKVWIGTDFPQNHLLASKTPLTLGYLKTSEKLPGMLVQASTLQDGGFAVAVKM
jgi:hypothetical protein